MSDIGLMGSYTPSGGTGLYSYRVDRDGTFERLDEASERDPSFLAVHPSGEFLVAVNEVDDGALTTYAVDRESDALSHRDRAGTGEAGPCHVAVDATGSYAVAAHYVGGAVTVHPLGEDGYVGEPADVVRHDGSSAHPERQTEPHPHSAVFGPENEYVYVPDLGTDRVYAYAFDAADGTLRPASTPHVDLHDGAGPRHAAVHPDREVLYVLNELDATLAAFDLGDEGRLTRSATVESIPGGAPEGTIAADVNVHPSGDWAYASNRGHDSITWFGLRDDPRRPNRAGSTPTGGEWPRNFALSPAGDRLLALNQRSDSVVPFRVGESDGTLRRTGDPVAVDRPSCLRFL
ncbi:lactonase family protein [Halostella sp. JP-L12]|uniref:lactonase family protein n=1 Tax=Halostella TaxID=1843185 RepID=UPI0013CEE3B6|nr:MULTISPECIES: lactonase family protein [Halostella]NHN49443.1 lactonase family protein [Halostella sp. JP-L12]